MTVKLFRRALKFNEPAKKLQAYYPHLMMLTNTRFLVTVLGGTVSRLLLLMLRLCPCVRPQ